MMKLWQRKRELEVIEPLFSAIKFSLYIYVKLKHIIGRSQGKVHGKMTGYFSTTRLNSYLISILGFKLLSSK